MHNVVVYVRISRNIRSSLDSSNRKYVLPKTLFSPSVQARLEILQWILFSVSVVRMQDHKSELWGVCRSGLCNLSTTIIYKICVGFSQCYTYPKHSLLSSKTNELVVPSNLWHRTLGFKRSVAVKIPISCNVWWHKHASNPDCQN